MLHCRDYGRQGAAASTAAAQGKVQQIEYTVNHLAKWSSLLGKWR